VFGDECGIVGVDSRGSFLELRLAFLFLAGGSFCSSFGFNHANHCTDSEPLDNQEDCLGERIAEDGERNDGCDCCENCYCELNVDLFHNDHL